MLLDKKRILITGVLTRQSIAFHIAKRVQEEGAEIILTGGPGKSSRLTEKVAQKLEPVPLVIPMDVIWDEQIENVRDEIIKRWGKFDGLLHSIAYAPPGCLGSNFVETSWDDMSRAFRISSYSLASLGRVFAPYMEGGSIASMDFDASVVWAYYNWMGVCKAGLESISRYMAYELGRKYGIRVNCISSGPLKTIAAKGIPEFKSFEKLWSERAILEWSLTDDALQVANLAVFLFSDLSKKITGEKIHVDGGFHIMGSPVTQ